MKNIKRLLCYTLVFISIMISTSCSKNKEEPKAEEEKEEFDIKIAKNILDTYMGYLIKEDIESAKKLYSKKLLEKDKGLSKTELKIFGYMTDEINEVGKSGLFKVRVARSNPNKSSCTLDIYNVKIEKESTDYKISEINSSVEKEVFGQNNTLRNRSKNNIKTNLLIDFEGIPQYTYPKDDKGKVNKVVVPKSNFGIISFAYSGDRIAINTYDKNSFIGVVKIDESLAVQGGGSGGGGDSSGSGGGGAGGQQGGSSSVGAREIPIGKELTAMDLISDSKVELLTFSLDEKYILVQYTKPQLGTNIRVYDVASGDLIPVSFEDMFPIGKVDVVFSSFDKDVLNIEVVEKKTTDKSISQLIGKWQVDLKEFKLKKL